MLEDGKFYRPARRRLQPDLVHRNITQREPFMYGTLLSDCLPRKRPTVFRERPLQEWLVSTLVHRKRPPLPRERPISRSMVADFLHKRRERERRPQEVHHHPEKVFGSKGSSLSRRCKSAPGHRRREQALLARPSVSASGSREEFSMIRALIDEVLPKERDKPTKTSTTTATTTPSPKQQRWRNYSAVAKLMKSNLDVKAVKAAARDEKDGEVVASPPRPWPVRPASAPFKLSPQNMSPDVLAETLATKKKNFLRKRPATAPPPRPMFHLPLSRIHHHNPPKAPPAKPAECAASRKPSVGSSSSDAAKDVPRSWSASSSSESHVAAATTTATTSQSSAENEKSGRRVRLRSPRHLRNKAFESGEDDSSSASPSSSSSSSSTTSSSSLSSESGSESSEESSLSSFIELPTPSTLDPDSIDEWLRKRS